ncbi:MAG: hypothetical protein V3T96_04400 [Thermodesulfobacteriota bacterium]
MVNGALTLVTVDIFLVIIAAYFGLQAVKIWKKCSAKDIFKLMGDRPKQRERLFYSALFLGIMMASLSVVHGLEYVANINLDAVDGPITTVLFLSIVILTYSWYGFLKDATS